MKSLVSPIRALQDKLTITLISETEQLSKKYQNITKQLEGRLTGDKSKENLRQVHNLQRSLSDLAIHAYIIPNFFTEQRVKDAYVLLGKSGEYLTGTQYEGRAAERPQEFLEIVEANKKAAEATERLSVEALRLAGAA